MRTIDAGHGPNNTGNGLNDPGAIANGYIERDLNRGLAGAVQYRWEQLHDEPVLVIDSGPYWTRDNIAAAAGTRQHTALHFDSGGPDATGTSVWVNRGSSSAVHSWARKIGTRVANAQGINFRGVFEKDFGTLGGKTLDCLIEVCFISNPTEIANYLAKHEYVANAIVSGMEDGVKPCAIEEEPPEKAYDIVLVHADNGTARSIVRQAQEAGKAVASRRVDALPGATNQERAAEMQEGIGAAVSEIYS